MNPSLNLLSKMLMGAGALLLVMGVIVYGAGRLLPGLGKLPGDFYFQKGNFSFYVPLATCAILSLVLTLIFNLFRKS